MAIKLGLGLPQLSQYDISRDVAAVARSAEEIGYEGLWVFEVTMYPTPMTQGYHGVPGQPWPECFRSCADPLVTLALAAAATERPRLGTSVLVAALHAPFQLARSLAALDVASRGRLVAGLGTGWSTDQCAAASIAPFEKRGAALDELLDVCAAVWGPDPVSHQGELCTIAPSAVNPKPAHPVPIFMPALSARSKRRLVDRADGWMPVAHGPRELADEAKKIEDLAVERGRERPLEVCLRAIAAYTPKPIESKDRMPFYGNAAQMAEDAAAHAEAHGIDELLLDLQITPRDAQELIDIAAEVHEAIRAVGI
ncbi:TIGR03619 family F420-dependent LLM class oxidoreductase [Streptomyces sp. NPDC051987]|uniref:TIGR03619 family F420-dependent LLM class oxidoreductase n=1 Tax=Streptomyces sp. NPDC051987 TaxID=3155808 RepID=UPI00342A8EA3